MFQSDRPYRVYADIAKVILLVALGMFLCGATMGVFAFVIVAIGVSCALADKIGPAICCFIFLPLCVIVNPLLVPKTGPLWGVGLRFGPLVIGLCLACGASRRKGMHRLPFAGILPFLFCAAVSSAVGYVPQISYLKLINYLVFLIGVWLGTQNFQLRQKDMELIRTFFLGVIFLLVWGSLALIPFPAISYATSLRFLAETATVQELNAVGREMLMAGDQTLFCGLTNHSQTLAPILAISMALLMCDMLFWERRFRIPHVVTIMAMLPMLYMTRSRVALLTGAGALAIISFYTVNRIQIGPRLRSSLRKGMVGFLMLVVVLSGVAEMRNQSITKWIRKTNDVSGDRRGVAEAFTGSRQGLIEQSMYDFHRNPMFGSGFQVAWEHQELWRRSNGFVISASIEKGVLPVMVLGETGVVGSIAFVFFLVSFYLTCKKRRLFVTLTMFALLLISNMGEASFFSPGGIGGVLWILTVLGGFVIDTKLLYGGGEQRLYDEY